MCVRRQDGADAEPKAMLISEGYAVYRVPVTSVGGVYNNTAISSSCAAHGLAAVCSHPAEEANSNGECVRVSPHALYHSSGAREAFGTTALSEQAVLYTTKYGGDGVFSRPWDNSYHRITDGNRLTWTSPYKNWTGSYHTLCAKRDARLSLDASTTPAPGPAILMPTPATAEALRAPTPAQGVAKLVPTPATAAPLLPPTPVSGVADLQPTPATAAPLQIPTPAFGLAVLMPTPVTEAPVRPTPIGTAVGRPTTSPTKQPSPLDPCETRSV